MKSIKPGRGPSMMGGIAGVTMILFGILWTVIASQFSPVMVLFGIIWTGLAIANTIYQFKNATSPNRYSAFDITDEQEEIDPLQARYGTKERLQNETTQKKAAVRFCPYCGTKQEEDFSYCISCGKKLPQ